MLPFSRFGALRCKALNFITRPPAIRTTSACLSTSSTNRRESVWPGQKSLTVMSDLMELKNAPAPAIAMGLAGLLPFVAAPFYMIHHGAFIDVVSTGQLAYGASILSFLGGVRWGMLVTPGSPIAGSWLQYSYAVAPSLVAWSALLIPPVAGCVTCIGGLGLAGYLDMTSTGYPAWFRGLRFVLTFVAIITLSTSLICKMILDEEKEETGVKEVEKKKEESK